MDDLQDLLEVALENAEDLHKELIKAIEAGEERATNQIEVSPISQGVIKVFTPGEKYSSAYSENDELADDDLCTGESSLVAVKNAMERMQAELRKTLTHLYDQGPETRECLEAVDMSRQDLVGRIDDYKLNRGPSPDPFESLIEQLEKFVEAPSTKRGHDVSRYSSDMVSDNSFGEEIAADSSRQTNHRSYSSGYSSPEKKPTRTSRNTETDYSPISVLQGDSSNSTKPTWVFESGRYRILRDVSDERGADGEKWSLYNPINPIKAVGGFLVTNAFKLVRSTAVVCAKGALVLSPVVVAVAASRSIKPQRTSNRHRTTRRATAEPATRRHAEKKNLVPPSAAPSRSAPNTSAQARKTPKVDFPKLTLNESPSQDTPSPTHQRTYMHFESITPKSGKLRPNLYSGQG